MAEERKLALQQQKIEAQRVTANTADSSRRIAAREAEVQAILAEERKLVLQEQAFEADRVTAATKASDLRIAARQREVAALLAADRKTAASATAQAEAQAAEAAARQARNLGSLSRGAASATLSFVGLRGATLAAGGAFLAGAAGVVAFGKALASAAKFQTSLNVFAATAGATADQMQRVEDVAKDLGADLTLPGVTANTAADALSGLSPCGSVGARVDRRGKGRVAVGDGRGDRHR